MNEPPPEFETAPCAVFEFRPDGVLIGEQRFDARGRPVSEYAVYPDGGSLEISSTWEEHGIKTRVLKQNGSTPFVEEWHRDDAGLMNSYRSSNQTAQYFYADERLDHIDYDGHYHGWGGGGTEWHSYDGGMLVAISGQLLNGDVVAKTNFTYHSSGALASRVSSSFGTQTSTRVSELHDESGHLIQRTTAKRYSAFGAGASFETQVVHRFPRSAGWHDIEEHFHSTCGRTCSETKWRVAALLDAHGVELIRLSLFPNRSDAVRTTTVCGSVTPRVKEVDLYDDGVVDERTDLQYVLDGRTVVEHEFRDGTPTVIRVKHHPCARLKPE